MRLPILNEMRDVIGHVEIETLAEGAQEQPLDLALTPIHDVRCADVIRGNDLTEKPVYVIGFLAHRRTATDTRHRQSAPPFAHIDREAPAE